MTLLMCGIRTACSRVENLVQVLSCQLMFVKSRYNVNTPLLNSQKWCVMRA